MYGPDKKTIQRLKILKWRRSISDTKDELLNLYTIIALKNSSNVHFHFGIFPVSSSSYRAKRLREIGQVALPREVPLHTGNVDPETEKNSAIKSALEFYTALSLLIVPEGEISNGQRRIAKIMSRKNSEIIQQQDVRLSTSNNGAKQ
jgi:hypothetical protein